MAKGSITFTDYQRRALATDVDPGSSDPLVPLLGLTGEIGELTAEFKKQQRADGVHYTGFNEAVAAEMGDILWYLATLARRTGHDLGDIAELNLRKTTDRWLAPQSHTSFDADFPADQQLPRQFDVAFTVQDGCARMYIADDQIGDAIDDNSHTADDYRFHDVFHLSYAAILGWSPILRALLGRKRKLNPVIDRVEDGARAQATEEAIAALVFKMAAPYSFFERQSRVDDNILTAVVAVASGLEVSDRTKAEWEKAIIAGFDVWRQLRDKGEGLVRVDLDARTLTFMG